MSNKVPQIRFTGYSDPWVQRKFGELYKKVTEKNDLSFGKDKIISVANMYFKTDESRSDDAYMRTYNIFRVGDIAFEGHSSKQFAYGRFVENTIGDGIVSHIFDVFRPISNYDLQYWKYAIINEQIMGRILMTSTTQSTMMNNLVSKDFLKRQLAVPTYEEQAKIGAFLESLDKLIAANQRKLDLLKEQKKGYLQKMFPKNGAKVPELRFAGFADAWEQRKLADVVSISAGGDVDKTKLIEDGGYPVLANALTNSGIVGYYDSYKVEAPAVTVTGRGDVGHSVARHVNFTPVVRLLSLKSEVLDADFLANMLNQTNILVESTGVPQLTAPQLGSYKILYPNLNEQTKIGKLLNAFDNLIALHQRKLDLLKKQKKGFLQKMFV